MHVAWHTADDACNDMKTSADSSAHSPITVSRAHCTAFLWSVDADVADTNLIECWEALDHGNGSQGGRGDDEACWVTCRAACNAAQHLLPLRHCSLHLLLH